MNIVFMGTPDFAVPCLTALLQAGHHISLVVTQPDKPKGRGHKLAFPPVKQAALETGIEVYQPNSLKTDEAVERLKAADAEAFVVVAYGKLLPERVLALPKKGCINVHASLLPLYRGAAPIQWAIVDGQTQTGVTTMLMEKGLDTGDMLCKTVVDITPEETASSLHDKLSAAGASLIVETLEQLERGELTPQKQDDRRSTYAPMISKETARLDFTRDARAVYNLIRGMYSYPMARTTYEGRLMKVARATYSSEPVKGTSGKIVSVGPEGIRVVCGAGSICITEVQFEGGKLLPVREYIKGHEIKTGVVLGQ